MSNGAKWYVVHTYSGYENKVAGSLEKIVDNRKLHDMILDIKVPTETVVEMKDNVKKEVDRKIFPGYVLIKMIMTDDTWYIVRNIRGVTGFVGPGSKPTPLNNKEVEEIGVEKKTEINVSFDVGDNVKICDGPLEGFVGVVEELSEDKTKVKILTSMFGRETPVELEVEQVEPID